MVEANELVLSVTARARMAAALPGLLDAVRGRRRRRRVRQLAAALLLVAVPAWWALAGAPPAGPPEPPSVRAWSLVETDPAVLARCTVPTVVRAEWFVDDAGLCAMLAADARPHGLVRAGDRVLVDRSAVDPWPGETP